MKADIKSIIDTIAKIQDGTMDETTSLQLELVKDELKILETGWREEILSKLKEQFELRKKQHALMCKDREENIPSNYACFETLSLIDILIRTAEEICASERNDG